MPSNSSNPAAGDAVLASMIDAIQQARSSGSTLQIQGSNSKSFLPATGQPASGVLDTRGYAGITCHDPSELFITAKAGTLLSEVEAALAAENQCLAFEPPHFFHVPGHPATTLGGTVASGLSGPARAQAGGLRDYVLGMQIVNGKGELLNFGGQVMKNVAGYDLSRLVAGSWGSLALITEVTLKVMPVMPGEVTLQFKMTQEHALQQLHQWGGQPLPLNASSWQAMEGEGTLLVRLRGAEAAVASASSALCTRFGGSILPQGQAQAYWQAVRNQTLSFFAASPQESNVVALWRLSVPQTTPALPVSHPQLVEWHGGVRWLWAPACGDEAQRLHELARTAGGHAQIFLPCASASTPAAAHATPPHTPAMLRIHQRLKAAFDPDSVFSTPYPIF